MPFRGQLGRGDALTPRRQVAVLIGTAALFVLALSGCPQRKTSRHEEHGTGSVAPRSAPSERSGAGDRVRLKARHGARGPLGVPVHRQPKGRRDLVGRAAGGELVRVLDRRFAGRWLKIRTARGLSGWISRRYVASVAPRYPVRRRAPPRRGAGICPFAAPRGTETLRTAAPTSTAKAGRDLLAATTIPRTITVVSYNVWELYDGRGRDRYLSRKHRDTLSPADIAKRVRILARAIAAEKPHVIAFQEIEDARLACRVAARAVPKARWHCAASSWNRGPSPQNMAIASRLPGSFAVLTPDPRIVRRGAVAFIGLAGKLQVLSVHYKSSRGAVGRDDCKNARKRMGLSTAIANYLARARGVAALVLGDFNVDPLDPKKAYDRTGNILTRRGFASLRRRYYPRRAPSTYPRYRSTIDLAFFRQRAGLAASGYRVLTGAPTDDGWSSDHRPIVVTLLTRK